MRFKIKRTVTVNHTMVAIWRKYIVWKMRCYKIQYKNIFLFILLFLIVLIFYRLSITWPAYVYQKDRMLNQKKIAGEMRNQGKCKLFSIRKKSKWSPKENLHRSGCQRIVPKPPSCDLAQHLFFSVPPASCSHQKEFEFCKLQTKSLNIWHVSCNDVLSKVCASPFSVGFTDNSTGALIWQQVGSSLQVSEKLSGWLQNLDSTSVPQLYGFCFIRCTLASDLKETIDESFGTLDGEDYYYSADIDQRRFATQLLVLPPQLHQAKQKLPPRAEINYNIVLIDSVSHQHFFRSLPKSVQVLESMNSEPNRLASVFDFELVQAVRSRTFESLQVIFSGEIDPAAKPFGTQDIPPEPLKVSYLLGELKRKGYTSLWLEDLCYLWEWGISKDLHFLKKGSTKTDTWTRMWLKLAESNIDSVGLTVSMCEILKVNKVRDHFHGPNAVCFNGRHQHEYLLDYLRLFQTSMEAVTQPFFTFTMTNVGHEDSGRRIQTLDVSLARYLQSAASLQNTLTVVFSDHGNAYGNYIQEVNEARIELFHPFMFFIIPDTVANKLGAFSMRSLGINSQRLVSFLDLHYTLRYLADSYNTSIHPRDKKYKISYRGLFDVIDMNRTCNDIPRIMPNLCICQDFDLPLTNTTASNLFGYFALGQLNNDIQRQLLRSSKINPVAFLNCQRLHLVGVQNVRKSFGKNGSELLKMDLHVQDGEVFFVSMTITFDHQKMSYAAELDMYDRLTPYSKFSACADDIDLALCVCDTTKPPRISTSAHPVQQLEFYSTMTLLPNFKSVVRPLRSDHNCMILVTIKHANGAVIFAANTCKDKMFSISLQLDSKIMYSGSPKKPVIMPGGMFAVGLLYSQQSTDWIFSIDVECKIITFEQSSL